MNVGLPGTGIGGMFYLLSALCMALVERASSLRGGRRPCGRWRLVARQTALAVGIAVGIWVTGWLLAVIPAGGPQIAAALRGAGVDGRIAPNVLRAATLAVLLATLALVIVSVWVAKLVVHGRGAGLGTVRPILRRAAVRKRWIGRRVAESDAA